MMVSFAEPIELTCPRCGTPFATETWVIVDGDERPDLVARILDGTLHDVTCPHCGQSGQAPAPLLYHDGRAGRVLLAVPTDMPEEEWRQAGQGLLWTLIGALAEERRGPYLGEVQAEAGLEGVAGVIRVEELAGFGPASEEEAVPPLVTAIQALLAANGPAALQHAVQQHPLLLDPQAVTMLRELAHEAFKQGEGEAGGGFSRAADILSDLRDVSQATLLRAPTTRAPAPAATAPAEDPLDELAYALLRSHTGELLAEAVDQYPQLLEAGMDEQLAAWADRARHAGKPRMAEGVDERREVLRVMRERYAADRPVLEAVQALLEAPGLDELESVLLEYDALYTDEADAVLERLATGGDMDFNAFVAERRAFLRRVRDALGDDPQGG